MGWFTHGEDMDKAQKERDQGRAPRRFFLRAPKDGREADEREIIFLEEVPFAVYEHGAKLGGDWKETPYTCAQGVFPEDPGCAWCRNGVYRYYVGYYTILDTTEFEFQGRVYSNLRRLFPAKLDTLKLIKPKQKRQGKLAGTRWIMSRTGSKEAKVGNVMDFVKAEEMVRDEKTGLMVLADRKFWYKDKDQVLQPPMPFDYQKLLHPVKNAEAMALLGGKPPEKPADSFDYGQNASDGPMSPDTDLVPYEE